ncbi:MAG: TIGR03619 family F420-dependent LLM class oxidoreductase [Nitrososphaerales archaeon]
MALKVGLGLPTLGELGSAENVKKIASFAESEGFDSVWVIERQLWPINPQTPYPVTPDGSFPTIYQKILDPIETLTFVAGITSKIKLGTGVVDMLYYNPTILAKRLATLDNLSEGRLLAGLGVGHSKDEFQAVGVPFEKRGERADEFLEVLRKIWTEDIVEHKGKYFSIPKSKIGPKPFQKPFPPIYLGGFSHKTFERIIKFGARGWLGVPLPDIDTFAQSIKALKEAAKNAGRDPRTIEFPTLIAPEVSEADKGQNRNLFNGSIDEIASDIKRLEEIGVDHVFVQFEFSTHGQDIQKTMQYGKRLLGKVR